MDRLIMGELAVAIPVLVFYLVIASLDILHRKGDTNE